MLNCKADEEKGVYEPGVLFGNFWDFCAQGSLNYDPFYFR